MLLERLNQVNWTSFVYVEMFVAGVAAGAYVVAAILEATGRGRSSIARSAHLMPWPLMLLAALLLTFDLSHPERFWHMLIMSERFLPILKPWSPMSVGSWLVLLFSAWTLVSFVDALVAHRVISVGSWRHDRTLHGSGPGLFWALAGAILGLAIGTYSGVLLNVTNFPIWANSPLLGAVYIATAMATGAAAVVLLQVLRGELDADLYHLAWTNMWLVGWWLLVVVVFLATQLIDPTIALSARLLQAPIVATVASVVLAGVLPLILAVVRPPRSPHALAVMSTLILIGGFLLRYGIVMAPQT